MTRLMFVVLVGFGCVGACGNSKKPSTAPINMGSGAAPAAGELGAGDKTPNAIHETEAPSAQEDPCAVPPPH